MWFSLLDHCIGWVCTGGQDSPLRFPAFRGSWAAAPVRCPPCLLTSGAVSTVHCLAPSIRCCWWPAGAAGGGCAHQDEDGGRPSRPRSYESLEGAQGMTVKCETLCVVGVGAEIGADSCFRASSSGQSVECGAKCRFGWGSVLRGVWSAQ